MTIQKISVLGGGAWGTALALTCARAGRDVTLWEHEADNAESLASKRESRFLPGVRLDDKIKVTRALGEASRADAILLVVPAQAMRSVIKSLAQTTGDGTPLIACAKGIEAGTHKFMTEVIAECAPRALPGILSGPSFAIDVARGLPTAVTVAAGDEAVARDLAHAMNTTTFRPYHASDVRGVELGGATKNVLAIAAGIVTGKGLGASALAALTTRGFAELVRFGRAFGAQDRNDDGPVRARRSDPDLLQPAVAQLLVRRCARQRRDGRQRRARQIGRRRLHRAGAAGDGARKEYRDADLGRGCRHSWRQIERRRGHRIAADTADQGGGMIWPTG